MRRLATGTVLSLVALPALLILPVANRPSPAPHPVPATEQAVALGSFDRPALGVAGAGAGSTRRTASRSLQVRVPRTRRFAAVAVTWRSDPALVSIRVSVRGRQGSRWSAWQSAATEEEGTPAAGQSHSGSDLVWLGWSTGIEARVTGAGGRSPQDVQLRLIDPGTSSADASAGLPAPRDSATAASTRPPINSRATWGADEQMMTWPPEYSTTIKAGFVHHTVQANGYAAADVPAMIRSDYYYHAVTRGWGDIGYNFLVDRFGRLWQGRAGDPNQAAIGAHTGGFNNFTFGVGMLGTFSTTPVPYGTRAAIDNLFAWKLSTYGRDPLGYTELTSTGGGTSMYPAGVTVIKPVIMGHRDVGATDCPGYYAYQIIPTIRAEVMKLVPVTGATDGGPTGPWPLIGSQVFATAGSSRVINGVPDSQAGYRLDIMTIQREAGAAMTGRYDSATWPRVQHWQALVGLPQTGVVDKLTWDTMAVR